jgi:Glucose dehydrogenase
MDRAGARERRRDHEQSVPAYVALDPTTGTVAVGFHDCRNDNGVPGPGGTNMIPNDDAEYYGTSAPTVARLGRRTGA